MVTSVTSQNKDGQVTTILSSVPQYTLDQNEKKTIIRTICGSQLRLTQLVMSFNVSFLTVLMLLMSGCLVTFSPVLATALETFSLITLYTFNMSR